MPTSFLTTTSYPEQATFQVGEDRLALSFQTAAAKKTATFTVGRKLDRLVLAITPNKKFMRVQLPAYSAVPVTLQVRREGETVSFAATDLLEVGQTGWYFPLSTDGVYYLTVLEEERVVAQQIVLVNTHALTALARLRKQKSVYFDRYCYYNGLAILFYECAEFAKCVDMLTLLHDSLC